MTDFATIQESERAIYAALEPLAKSDRDRVLRHVHEQLNTEREPLRLEAARQYREGARVVKERWGIEAT